MPETPTVMTLVVVEETEFNKLVAAAKARSEPNRIVKGLLDELELADEGSDKLSNVAHTLMIQRDAAVDARDTYRDAHAHSIKEVDELRAYVEGLKESRDLWRRAYEEALRFNNETPAEKRSPSTFFPGPVYGPAGIAAPPLPPFPAMFYTRDATAVPNASAAQSFPPGPSASMVDSLGGTAMTDFEDRNRK